MPDAGPPSCRRGIDLIAMARQYWSLAAGIALLGVSFLGSLALGHHLVRAAMPVLTGLPRLGPAGWAGFVLLQALVAMIGLMPASLLGLAAGAIYGPWSGFVLSALGVMLGALGSFALARSVLRDIILRIVSRRHGLHRIDDALAADGLRLVLLMRISPAMPFSLTSFALGLSGIGARSYFLGTLASLPALFLYVLTGALGADSVSAFGHGAHDAVLAMLGIGILATIVLSLRIGQLIAKALRIDRTSDPALSASERT